MAGSIFGVLQRQDVPAQIPSCNLGLRLLSEEPSEEMDYSTPQFAVGHRVNHEIGRGVDDHQKA